MTLRVGLRLRPGLCFHGHSSYGLWRTSRAAMRLDEAVSGVQPKRLPKSFCRPDEIFHVPRSNPWHAILFLGKPAHSNAGKTHLVIERVAFGSQCRCEGPKKPMSNVLASASAPARPTCKKSGVPFGSLCVAYCGSRILVTGSAVAV